MDIRFSTSDGKELYKLTRWNYPDSFRVSSFGPRSSVFRLNSHRKYATGTSMHNYINN